MRCKDGVDPLLIGYLLMLPEMCEAYRMLQSGKRHARLDPSELLELRIDINLTPEKLKGIQEKRLAIDETKKRISVLRNDVDSLLTGV